MARFEVVRFDDWLPHDTAAFAIVPIDGFTGSIVRGPVTAETMGVRARRNLSGMLFFVGLPREDKYTVEIKAEAAGFFDDRKEVTRPADDAPDWARLMQVVLRPLPTAPFTKETTLIRGLVHHRGEPVEGAEIAAITGPVSAGPPREPAGKWPYRTRSDRRGAFVLPIRLPSLTPGQAGLPAASIWLRICKNGLGERPMERRLTDEGSYSFGRPIDLAEDDTHPTGDEPFPPPNPILVPTDR